MYPLLETIKVHSGEAQHLKWHQERLRQSYRYLFNQPSPFDLNILIEVPSEYGVGQYRCRFLYGRKGYRVEYSPYEPRVISSLKLVEGNELEYSVKYTDRNSINELLSLKGACDDILIVKNGLITDTSFTNIVFYTGSRWITPKIPLLNGTARMRLISEGVIETADIKPEALVRMKGFRLINAMLEFQDQQIFALKAIDYQKVLPPGW